MHVLALDAGKKEKTWVQVMALDVREKRSVGASEGPGRKKEKSVDASEGPGRKKERKTRMLVKILDVKKRGVVASVGPGHRVNE